MIENLPDRLWYEYLDGGTVINARRSMLLQNLCPEVKPVVKGTAMEILELKRRGQILPGRVVYIVPSALGHTTDPSGTVTPISHAVGYILHEGIVQAIYGLSMADSIREAIKDLQEGGDKESALLGYPRREGLTRDQTIDVVVDHFGDVLTDRHDILSALYQLTLIWAAEGEPAETLDMAKRVAILWKLRKFSPPEPLACTAAPFTKGGRVAHHDETIGANFG